MQFWVQAPNLAQTFLASFRPNSEGGPRNQAFSWERRGGFVEVPQSLRRGCLENFENGISTTTKIAPNRKPSRITLEIYKKKHIYKIIADFGNPFFEACPELIALEATYMFCFSNRGIRGT